MNHRNQNSQIIQRTWKWQSRIKKNWNVRAIQPCPPDGGRWEEFEGWPEHEVSPVRQDNRLQMTEFISELRASYLNNIHYALGKPMYIKQQCHTDASMIILIACLMSKSSCIIPAVSLVVIIDSWLPSKFARLISETPKTEKRRYSSAPRKKWKVVYMHSHTILTTLS